MVQERPCDITFNTFGMFATIDNIKYAWHHLSEL